MSSVFTIWVGALHCSLLGEEAETDGKEGGRGGGKIYEHDRESGEDGVSLSLSCEGGVRFKESL